MLSSSIGSNAPSAHKRANARPEKRGCEKERGNGMKKRISLRSELMIMRSLS